MTDSERLELIRGAARVRRAEMKDGEVSFILADFETLFRHIEALERSRRVLCPYEIDCPGWENERGTIKCQQCMGKMPYPYRREEK